MDLRSLRFRKWWGSLTSFGALGFLLIAGCERDNQVQFDRNRPPETYITEAPDNSETDDPVDLFYRAHLYWRGEDVDGTIAGFRYAIDDTNDLDAWKFTAQTDSTFRFPVGEVGSREHLFLIRSVDNLGKQDPTPDTLRFEAFTSSSPVVRFDMNKSTVNGQSGLLTQSGEDTVFVFSDVTLCWTGSDADGEIVAWESKFDGDLLWRFHDRNDTCRTEVDLLSGQHTMLVRAIDDAGAKSTQVGRFAFRSNHDPKTVIDRSSVRAVLARPWISPTDTLVVNFDPLLPDTVDQIFPSQSLVSFCWSSTDVDGPIVDYFWSFAGQTQRVPHPGNCGATPFPILIETDGRIPLTVRGRDIYGQPERPSDTLEVVINFPPEPTFVNQNPGNVHVGPPVQFAFTADDIDSDPAELFFDWRFYNSPQPSGPFSKRVQLQPEDRFIERSFVPSEVGVVGLELRAFEIGGSRTVADTITFNVVP